MYLDKQKTEYILEALTKQHTHWGKSRSNIIFPELRLGSGYCGVAQRRIDMFVINSGAGNVTTSFEIKVSKNDFKHETDLKQRGARLYSNYFYYVTPKDLLKPEDIPVWAGLWELDIDDYIQNGRLFREVVPAPLHAKAMPSWGLICSMIRHVNKDCGKQTIQDLQNENNVLRCKLDKAQKLLNKIANNEPYFDWQLIDYKSLR